MCHRKPNRAVSAWCPVQPGGGVVLAIGVVVAVLAMAHLVARQQHRCAQRKNRGGQQGTLVAQPQVADAGVVRGAFHAEVGGEVVAVAVAVVFTIGFVVTPKVAHQIAQGEAIVRGDEVDAAVWGRGAGVAKTSLEPASRCAKAPRVALTAAARSRAERPGTCRSTPASRRERHPAGSRRARCPTARPPSGTVRSTGSLRHGQQEGAHAGESWAAYRARRAPAPVPGQNGTHPRQVRCTQRRRLSMHCAQYQRVGRG